MTTQQRAAELAQQWIEAWIRMDIEWLRQHLTPDFVHTSPFGTLEGRDHYLETVEPLARKSVTELVIKTVISTGDQAAIWFENRTPNGVVESCDWVRIDGDHIKTIMSFYDSTKIRGVLSPDQQQDLGGSYPSG